VSQSRARSRQSPVSTVVLCLHAGSHESDVGPDINMMDVVRTLVVRPYAEVAEGFELHCRTVGRTQWSTSINALD
jgi:hypothetical protein